MPPSISLLRQRQYLSNLLWLKLSVSRMVVQGLFRRGPRSLDRGNGGEPELGHAQKVAETGQSGGK